MYSTHPVIKARAYWLLAKVAHNLYCCSRDMSDVVSGNFLSEAGGLARDVSQCEMWFVISAALSGGNCWKTAENTALTNNNNNNNRHIYIPPSVPTMIASVPSNSLILICSYLLLPCCQSAV